jgi:hypothetical protein
LWKICAPKFKFQTLAQATAGVAQPACERLIFNQPFTTYVSHGFLGIGSLILQGASVLTDDLNLAIPTSFSPCIKKYSC